MQLSKEDILLKLVTIRGLIDQLVDDMDQNGPLDQHQILTRLEFLEGEMRGLVMRVAQQTPNAPDPPPSPRLCQATTPPHLLF